MVKIAQVNLQHHHTKVPLPTETQVLDIQVRWVLAETQSRDRLPGILGKALGWRAS